MPNPKERSIPLPAHAIAILQQAQFDGQVTAMGVVKRSATGLAQLRKASIPFVVTKGPGIAILGRSVSDRPFVDVDVVVPPARFFEALRLLRSIGYTERTVTTQTWDSFNRYCREAINLRNKGGGSIDLHHCVSPWYWSKRLTFDLLQLDARLTTVYGEDLPLVSPVHNLLVAALHIVSDKSRPGQTLRAWRDFLILVDRCPVDEVVYSASKTRLIPWLRWIVGCLPPSVQPTELLSELENFNQQMKGRTRLRMLMPPRIGSRHPIGQVFRLPIANAALYASGTMIPSPAYLRIRYPSENQRYMSWWQEAVHSFTDEAIASARPFDQQQKSSTRD